MIWDEAHGADSPGCIILVYIRMSYPDVLAIFADVPDFTITSPTGQYHAPDFQGGQINQESRALFRVQHAVKYFRGLIALPFWLCQFRMLGFGDLRQT